MNLATLFHNMWRRHRYATADDVRTTFGDHRNVLDWLAAFLVADERAADKYIIDACTLTEKQTLEFHDWLVHWAARATLRSALQSQREQITRLGSEYERRSPMHAEHPPLSLEQYQALIRNSKQVRAELDVLCRFVLIIRGIAKESCDAVAAELGISCDAVERAYCVAFDLLSPVDNSLTRETPLVRAFPSMSE